MQSEKIIISLGGSLVVPEEIDLDFIKKFTEIIKTEVKKGSKFIISPGGGRTARKYQDGAKKLGVVKNEDLDWIGIESTRLNSELLRALFGDLAHGEIIVDPDDVPVTSKPILVGGSWKPGNSSDLAAVHMAGSVGAKKIVNLSNIDYVYDKDPKIFPNAVKIEKISWENFRKLLPDEWEPGLNVPFDPMAAKKADSLGLEVIIMNGNNIENFKKYLQGEKFIGTVIS